MFCALVFADDMLAGLVARVKKLRTKLMVGELCGTEVEFVVIESMVCILEGYVACFIGMRESLQSGPLFLGQNMTLFVSDSIILEAAQLSQH